MQERLKKEEENIAEIAFYIVKVKSSYKLSWGYIPRKARIADKGNLISFLIKKISFPRNKKGKNNRKYK